MAYSPPAGNAADLDLTGTYTPPAGNAADLSIPFTGDENVEVPVFESTTGLVSGVLWFSTLADLEQNTELEAPGVLLQVFSTDFESSTNLFITTTRRISLLNFEQINTFGPEFIAEVPEGTTVVGAWPFVSNTSLDRPDFAHILDAEFNQDSSFSTPVIIANNFAEIVAANFETTSALSVDIMPAITVFDFGNISQLDILAILSAPAGDQYTFCPDFEQNSELETPAFLAALPIPNFEQDTALVVSPIYSGIVVSPVTFVSVSDINATPHPGIYLSDFNSGQILESGIMPAVSIPDFEQVSGLFAGVQSGMFIELPEFSSRVTIEVATFFELPLTDFEQDSVLDGFDISEFISAPDFNVNGELLLDKINVFTLEFAQIRYFLTITGAADGVEDVEIPFVSFQARRRSGADTYLQVVVPSTEFIDSIIDRANGTMRIDQAYVLAGEIARRQNIIETTMDQVNPYQGGISDTLVLIGYKTTTYTPKNVTLTDATYRAQIDGKLSYRLPTPDILLNPGDLVTIGEDEFTLGIMSYTVSGEFQQIDLTEA